MASYYNHRWLGDAEEQRPLQPAQLHPQQPAPPGAVIYPHPPGAYYTAPDHNYPHVVIPLHPHNTSSSSSSSSSSLLTPSAPPLGPTTSEAILNASYQRGGRVTPPVSAPSAYAHNPEGLFRTSGSDGGHYPQQQFGPVAGDEYAWQVQQLRERNARVIQQQRAIKESNHKHFPLFLLLASVAQCAMMGVEVWKNGGFEPISVNPFFGPSVETLIYLGAKDVPLIVDNYEVWRFFSPIFLHAGLIHLALNLIFQLQCITLERQLGFVRVALIYIVSGFGGNLASSLFLPQLISVGASGALFGLVGTIFVVLLRNWSLVQSPCRSLVLLCIMIAISLFLGLLPNVDNFAHVGGLVTGFVASFIVVPSMKPGAKAGPVRLLLASVALLALAAGLGLGVYALFEDVPLREWCSFCSMINCVDFGQDWCESVNNPT